MLNNLAFLVALANAGAFGHNATTRHRRRLSQSAKPENPYRFNHARYKCAADGEQCACDGPVTWHPSSTPAPPSVVAKGGREVACNRDEIVFNANDFYGARPGYCVCHAVGPEERPTARNLLFINGVGKQRPRLRIVEANVASHVRGKGWDCIIAVYATEDELPSRRLARLAEVCHIHRDPEKRWGQLLRTLTPAIARRYDRVAIMLDDVRLPAESLAHMELAMEKDMILDVYSPSIQRAHHRSTKTQGHYSKGERCLRIVRGFEFYFTIFMSDAWSKFYARLLLDDHPGGCGYDLCFEKALPGLMVGVDHRISATHVPTRNTNVKMTDNPCDWSRHTKVCGGGAQMLKDPGKCVAGSRRLLVPNGTGTARSDGTAAARRRLANASRELKEKSKETSCRDNRRYFIVEKINRAGLSSRLVRLSEALAVACALKASLIVPTPSKCLAHGIPDHSTQWSDLIDVDAFSAKAWERCLPKRAEWPCERLGSKYRRLRAGPRKVQIATKAQFDVWMRDHGRDQGPVTFRMPSHRLLALLARGRPLNHVAAAWSRDDAHNGAFPASPRLRAVAAQAVNLTFAGRRYYAIKVRRGDKLNRGFEQCTAPAAVAQALRNTLAADRKLDTIKDVFIMSDEPCGNQPVSLVTSTSRRWVGRAKCDFHTGDEKHTSPWWKELKAAIQASTPQITVATENSIKMIRNEPKIKRYITALQVLHSADKFLVTQKRTGATQNYLCANYHNP